MLVQTDRTPSHPPPKTTLKPPAALQRVNKIKNTQDQQGINLICALSAVRPWALSFSVFVSISSSLVYFFVFS